MQDTISLTIDGETIHPHTLPAKELAALLSHTEELISSVARATDPGAADVKLCLVDIADKCCQLSFSPIEKERAFASIKTIDAAIREQDFLQIPQKGRDSLAHFQRFCQNNKASISFATGADKNERYIPITSETKLPPPLDRTFSGDTTIYAKIMRVGGKDPRVQITTMNDEVLFCDTSRQMAVLLGARLYSIVELHGGATWDMMTKELVAFKIESLGDYQEQIPEEAFQAIAQEFPAAFDDVENVEAFVDSLRYGGDD